ncbi:ribonuclease Z [Pseudenhygromyxa sp. WMMC2535]|nr:ribonuclease Z [Pseudenhygromyxa sp. WMMC2535]
MQGEPSGPELVFVGTGEAVDPQLPNTSLLLRGPRTLLLDCGYAVPHAFWSISRDVELLDAIWISHAHADHCFGLPALLLWMRLGGRRRPLTLFGGPGSQARLSAVLELGYPGSFAAHKCFAIEFVELAPGEAARFGPLRLGVAATAHSLANYALRVEAPGQRSVVYSGDGAPTPESEALIAGVDVLVHECFFLAAKPEGARRHGALDELLALASAAEVSCLAPLHFAAEAKAELRAAAQAGAAERGLGLFLAEVGDRLSLAPD